MDKRKILMCMIILLIIVIVFILILLGNINTEKEYKNEYNEYIENNSTVNSINFDNAISQISNEISQDDKIILNTTDYFDVKIKSVYYAIKDISIDFFESVNLAFNEKDAKQFYGEEFYLSEMELKKEKVYSLLGNEYINKEGITKQNLGESLAQYSSCIFNVEKIIEKIKENNICIFIVYGTINENTTYNIAVVTDETNLNYTIYPYEYLNKYDIDNLNISEIAENKYNKLEYKDIDDETIVKDHFSDYKYYMQTNLEKAYNKLDGEYKAKRFGNINLYKDYINNNMDIIKNNILKNFKILKQDDYTIYDCVDNYGYHYIFKEKSIMQYSVLLDNYTFMLDEDLKYYNSLDKYDKSKYNLSKFIYMLNTNDYNAIYNVLDTTFRNNNFKNVDILKQYLENNLYKINSLEIEDYDDETYEYYVFTCKITNSQDINKSKNMTIIINQSEGTEFTMSFSLI